MVNRLKLNEKLLREAEPKPSVSYQIFDTEVIGFAARVQASGARTFTIDYRHAGRQRRMTIGRWPEWSVTAFDGSAASRDSGAIWFKGHRTARSGCGAVARRMSALISAQPAAHDHDDMVGCGSVQIA